MNDTDPTAEVTQISSANSSAAAIAEWQYWVEQLSNGFGGTWEPTEEFVLRIRDLSEELTDLGALNGARSDMSAWLAKYRALGHDSIQIKRAERFLELRIGELLAPYRPGRKTSISGLPPAAPYEFRRLAQYKKDVTGWMELGVVTRAQLLAKIREKEGDDQLAMLPDTHYQVIYADPPWRYDAVETPDIRAVEQHYTTMPQEDLCALSPPAAPDSVLFLWATNPKLPEALEVMAAWGFQYRTNLAWVKPQIGMGYYVRSAHELLLIGKRGSLTLPVTTARPRSWLEASRRGHSQKPPEFRGLIDVMYPHVRKLEMFSRDEPTDGWDTWGHETRSGSEAAEW
jgi:N6-adenosine-specific RNA methylase IME4